MQKQFNLNVVLEIELQKKKNKMGRSSWKFFSTNIREIYLYLKEYKLIIHNKNLGIAGFKKNNFVVNPLNYMYKYLFHVGKSFVWKRFRIYNLKNQAKEFLKFTKPYHFRSKKKKKITVSIK